MARESAMARFGMRMRIAMGIIYNELEAWRQRGHSYNILELHWGVSTKLAETKALECSSEWSERGDEDGDGDGSVWMAAH